MFYACQEPDMLLPALKAIKTHGSPFCGADANMLESRGDDGMGDE